MKLKYENAKFSRIAWSCTLSACYFGGVSYPGIAPFGLTSGCTLARFQRVGEE